MDLAQQEGSCALPPVGRKTHAEMADSIMIEFALEGEEQKAVLVRANLDLFVGGLEIDAGTEECPWRVTRLGGQC